MEENVSFPPWLHSYVEGACRNGIINPNSLYTKETTFQAAMEEQKKKFTNIISQPQNSESKRQFQSFVDYSIALACIPKSSQSSQAMHNLCWILAHDKPY